MHCKKLNYNLCIIKIFPKLCILDSRLNGLILEAPFNNMIDGTKQTPIAAVRYFIHSPYIKLLDALVCLVVRYTL